MLANKIIIGFCLFLISFSSIAQDSFKYLGPILEIRCEFSKIGVKKKNGHSIKTAEVINKTILNNALGKFCKQDLSLAKDHIEMSLDELLTKKVHKVVIREYDEVLYDFLKLSSKENCSTKYAINIKNKWIISYNVRDPRCL